MRIFVLICCFIVIIYVQYFFIPTKLPTNFTDWSGCSPERSWATLVAAVHVRRLVLRANRRCPQRRMDKFKVVRVTFPRFRERFHEKHFCSPRGALFAGAFD